MEKRICGNMSFKRGVERDGMMDGESGDEGNDELHFNFYSPIVC